MVKPAHELLGELLLAQGKPAEAQQAFVRSLALAPRRAASPAAVAARADLRAMWHQADDDLPGLTEIARPAAQAR